MKNKFWLNLILVFLLWVFSVYYSMPRKELWYDMPLAKNSYKLGLDLQWGIELDYKVDYSEIPKEDLEQSWKKDSILEWLKSIIDKRIEALKINDSVITTSNYIWEDHIIVQIPLKWTNKAEDEQNIQRAKEAIWKVMKIEFKEQKTEFSEEDTQKRIELANDVLTEVMAWEYDFSLSQTKFNDSYENIETWNMTLSQEELEKFFTLDISTQEAWVYNKVIDWKWLISYEIWEDNTIVPVQKDEWKWIIKINDIVSEENKTTSEEWEEEITTEQKIDFDYIFVSSKPGDWIAAQDSEWRILNDQYFITSSVSFNQAMLPQIELSFNTEWAKIFGELTTRLKGQPIAIYVWGEQLTAPIVNDAILNGKAVITWDYSIESARELSNSINTWVVPAPIYLTSERSIDSKLWINSLEQLFIAWVIGYLIILVFLIIIYRVAGLSAWISLFMYLTLLLAVSKLLGIVLTLASIAWIILTLWMAIDANILIFERLKDELRAWKKAKDVIEFSFKKSWSAIWDSNLTWLIISIILFVFWVNMIKWFGLMLGIWIVISLFTAMFVSKLFIKALIKLNLSNKLFIWIK